MYARVDLGVLSDITEMHQTTERRQEKIAEIQSQLEKQIRNMEKFIFDVSSGMSAWKHLYFPQKQLPENITRALYDN